MSLYSLCAVGRNVSELPFTIVDHKIGGATMNSETYRQLEHAVTDWLQLPSTHRSDRIRKKQTSPEEERMKLPKVEARNKNTKSEKKENKKKRKQKKPINEKQKPESTTAPSMSASPLPPINIFLSPSASSYSMLPSNSSTSTTTTSPTAQLSLPQMSLSDALQRIQPPPIHSHPCTEAHLFSSPIQSTASPPLTNMTPSSVSTYPYPLAASPLSSSIPFPRSFAVQPPVPHRHFTSRTVIFCYDINCPLQVPPASSAMDPSHEHSSYFF